MAIDETSFPSMEALFGRGGPFSRTLAAYEERPQQTRLAQAVARALDEGSGYFLAAEAPTGVGKSFALLAPAMLRVLDRGERLLFLTAGIPLQEQLLNKDLPLLASTLERDVAYGLLKGRRNYACLLKVHELGGEGYLSFNDGGFASSRIVQWAAETETGDLSELDIAPSHPLAFMP
ncbi:MAG: ATP-dependent DNA helicase, partial [Synergistales bacterium]|nr:ATP-dependent DNA helicase [Synergistales bacterium]